MPLYSESWPDGSRFPKGKTKPELDRKGWHSSGFSDKGVIEYDRTFINGGLAGTVHFDQHDRWRWWVREDLGQEQSSYLAASHRAAALACEDHILKLLRMAEKELSHENIELPVFWIQVTESQYVRRYINVMCSGMIYQDDTGMWGWSIGYNTRRCASDPTYESDPFHPTAASAAAECDQRIRTLVRKALVELTPKTKK